mmetsp:Transcript_14017/g.31946  ORF Transcript_14017/g.31946 Transcript_14017/m.31946 type:complete len:333 (-) Transcript_14017:166-1164(-)
MEFHRNVSRSPKASARASRSLFPRGRSRRSRPPQNVTPIFVTVSLLAPKNLAWIEENRNVTALTVLPAVNGFDRHETICAAVRENVSFHQLCGAGARGNLSNVSAGVKLARSWGGVACFLSHIRQLRHQVQHRLPLVIFVEDDVKLTPMLVRKATDSARGVLLRGPFQKGDFRKVKCFREGRREACTSPDILRMGPWGEMYATHLRGAEKVLADLRAQGIRGCHDQQFNQMLNVSMAVHIIVSWKNMNQATNRGDIWKTPEMGDDDITMLRGLRDPNAPWSRRCRQARDERADALATSRRGMPTTKFSFMSGFFLGMPTMRRSRRAARAQPP